MIGTKLAHFTITAHLGSGGMGDVYQATDSKLGRSVAIKLLPEAFSHDTDRAARFEREARVLASLNHPNIAAIYGIEEAGGRKFLVMELVPGETLAERIKRGPIPIAEAVGIAKQILEALEAAHDSDKVIIHRDLKPANVKVTPDGKVKVLDFGLAKAFAGEAANANLSDSPTLSIRATNAGVILGTAAYMSPEQAKGTTVDRRTDIFAFGAVLYEMLSGQKAFPGDTVTEILATVLKVDPDWSRLPVDTPPSIRRLLRRCLQKERNRRLQTAWDAQIEIEEAYMDPPTAPRIAVPERSKIQQRLAWIVAGAFLIGMVALAIPTARRFRESPPTDVPEMRVDITTPAQTSSFSFALSPDGRRLVFAAAADGLIRLWVRPLDAVTAQPLAGTEGAAYPFWSPDSRSIGFFASGSLKRIDIGGGLPQVLAAAPNPRGGAWGPDGVILFNPDTNVALVRITASGGEAVAVTKLGMLTSHRFPQFLPDGRRFLFYGVGTPERGIYIGSLDSAETKLLTPDAETAGAYLPPGWLLFVQQGTLVARRLDLSKMELAGEPITVAGSVGAQVGTSDGGFSVSSTGIVAYRAGGLARRQLTWFDRSGKSLGTLGSLDESNLNGPSLTPDGRQAAVYRTVSDNTDVWLIDSVRTARFTFNDGNDNLPRWSPDGNRIAFDSNRKGHRDLYVKPSNNASSEEVLLESLQDKAVHDWSPDARFLLYSSRHEKTQYDIWVLPMDGDRKPFVFLNTPANERGSQFSPDGRWVAYHSDESGKSEIYVRPFTGPGGQSLLSTSGGAHARWRPDGKELYYIAPDGKLMAVPVAVKGAAFDAGPPKPLFQSQIWDTGILPNASQQYDVAPDGRFLINVAVEDATTQRFTLLLNWSPEQGK